MKNKCPVFSVLIFLLLTIKYQVSAVYANNKPIITLSYGTPYMNCNEKCEPSFIIKIFEDGLVQYKGVKNVDILGSDEHRIDKVAVEKLIKKFEKAHFFDAIGKVDPSWLPANAKDRDTWRYVPGIRFRQGRQERTIYGIQCDLVNEIFKATDAKQWELEWIHRYFCR